MGANQKSQSCDRAHVPAKIAGPVLRAGLTEVLVTGMLMRWISVRHSPIAIGANPAGARESVDPRMTIRKKNVSCEHLQAPTLVGQEYIRWFDDAQRSPWIALLLQTSHGYEVGRSDQTRPPRVY